MPKFTALRKALVANDIDHGYLSEKLGRSAGYVSTRMNAKKPWNMGDVYAILELLKRPPEDIPALFPKDGMYYENPSPSNGIKDDKLNALIALLRK